MKARSSKALRLVAWMYPSGAAVRFHKQPRAAGVGARLATIGLLLVAGPAKAAGHDRHLSVTDAWRGMWEVTVDYVDPKTGALMATDVTTAPICPGAPIKPPLLNTLSSCSGSSGDGAIKLSCRAKHAPRRGCNVLVDVSFESDLNGDAWNGAGQWTAKVVGDCEHLELGEDFVVSGRRLSRRVLCESEEPSLVERFFVHGPLIPVIGRSGR